MQKFSFVLGQFGEGLGVWVLVRNFAIVLFPDRFCDKPYPLVQIAACRPPNFWQGEGVMLFIVFPSLPVCATLKTFVHVSNPFCTELPCLYCQNLPNTSFDLAGFCKTVQASISKDAKTLQSSRPNSAWGAYAFVTARAFQNSFKFVSPRASQNSFKFATAL